MRKDPDYKGCAWNVLVLWSDGSKMWEPLTLMIEQDPVMLAAFSKENDFLDAPGWKRLRKTTPRAKVLTYYRTISMWNSQKKLMNIDRSFAYQDTKP